MDAETTYTELKAVGLREFPDVVLSATVIRGPLNVAQSLRFFFIDRSFLEVWISGKKYSYHWQRIDRTVYRHDNAPHKKHQSIATFPKHFHDTSEENVRESYLSNHPIRALCEFLEFIRHKIEDKR